jgi:hypothetical protein
MENTEVVFIKEVVCEAFCLEDTDLSKKCSQAPYKMAQYMFCYFAYNATLNKYALKELIGVSHVYSVDAYLRKHDSMLTNATYKKISIKIEAKLNEIQHNN